MSWLGNKSVDRIITADVMAVLMPIWNEKRETARRVRQRLSAVMKWSVAQGYRDDNPAGDAIGAALPKAAEKHRRQWLGIDQWRGAFNVVKQRMEDNRQLLVDVPEIYYSTAPPIRTDDRAEASPSLVLKVQVPEPTGQRVTHSEMKAFLIQQDGGVITCKGCLRVFDDPRYLELDHNTPRADGGLNHVSNRLLLCGPCNRAKSNTFDAIGVAEAEPAERAGWLRTSRKHRRRAVPTAGIRGGLCHGCSYTTATRCHRSYHCENGYSSTRSADFGRFAISHCRRHPPDSRY